MGAEHCDSGSYGIHFNSSEHLLSQILGIYQTPGEVLCLLGPMYHGLVGVNVRRSGSSTEAQEEPNPCL